MTTIQIHWAKRQAKTEKKCKWFFDDKSGGEQEMDAESMQKLEHAYNNQLPFCHYSVADMVSNGSGSNSGSVSMRRSDKAWYMTILRQPVQRLSKELGTMLSSRFIQYRLQSSSTGEMTPLPASMREVFRKVIEVPVDEDLQPLAEEELKMVSQPKWLQQLPGALEGWIKDMVPTRVLIDKSNVELYTLATAQFLSSYNANLLSTDRPGTPTIHNVWACVNLHHYSAFLARERAMEMLERRRRGGSSATALANGDAFVRKIRVFHGTSETVVPMIVESGVDPLQSHIGPNGSWYGKGSNFAADSSYSRDDKFAKPNAVGHKFMFVARLLVGRTCQGSSGMVQGTPIVPGVGETAIPSDRADTAVNDLAQPKIFVVFERMQSYPEFVIEFSNH